MTWIQFDGWPPGDTGKGISEGLEPPTYWWDPQTGAVSYTDPNAPGAAVVTIPPPPPPTPGAHWEPEIPEEELGPPGGFTEFPSPVAGGAVVNYLFDGVETSGDVFGTPTIYRDPGVYGAPVAIGVLGVAAIGAIIRAALRLGPLTIGFVRGLLARYARPQVLKALTAVFGVLVAERILDEAFDAGIENNRYIPYGAKKRRKRYSIGHNPRLGTLIRVAKHTDRITRKFAQRMRHAGLIRSPGRHAYRPMPYHRLRAHHNNR